MSATLEQWGLGVVALALAGVCVLVVGWGVKQIWKWKEPMSTPAIAPPLPEPAAWVKRVNAFSTALEEFFRPIFEFVGKIIAVIRLLCAAIVSLWLLFVLIKSLWARAPQL